MKAPNPIRPVRIGLVGPLPPPSGGMANQTRQLARLLSEAGLGVSLVQVNAPYRPQWVEHLPVVRAFARLLPYTIHLWRTAATVDLVHVMANSGWAWHLFAAPAIWVASLRGKPVIVNYRGGEAEGFFKKQFFGVRPTLNRASMVVVPSAFLEAVFAKWAVPTRIVPNIIDLSRFHPTSPPGQIHLVVTRNLEDLYDIPTAIEAFAIVRKRHPSARLTIAGTGPKHSELEAMCGRLGLADAVRFTGRLDNERMAGLYQSATLMLNPSLADNMPISLLEAMASGVPIVSTNVGGIPYLARDGITALLVAPKNPQAMANAVLRLLDDPRLVRRLREAGLSDVQQYTWDHVRGRLFDVYAQALQIDSLFAPARSIAR